MNEIFLTSTEFAKAIGVSLSTLKNWERDDILHPYMRTPTGKRLYTQAQVEWIGYNKLDKFFKVM